MITYDEVLVLHNLSIRDYGGSYGIRDSNLLKSALIRPFQVFDKNELYPSVLEKAASLIESIVQNHPFVDGNKRTGFIATYIFLYRNQLQITAHDEEAYNFVMNIASSQIAFNEIVH